MDVFHPSSSSKQGNFKHKKGVVPHKVLVGGQKAQQYRVLLAKKPNRQVAKHTYKNVLNPSHHKIYYMPAQMRPPAPVYRAGVPQMPVRYMTTPNGMSVCTSPTQMMTDELPTFAQMPSNYEYPDGRHLDSEYSPQMPQGRYYQMVDQYGNQPRWEAHPPGGQRVMYENTPMRGQSAFKPRMMAPVPHHHVQSSKNNQQGKIYDHSQQFLDAYDQSQGQGRTGEHGKTYYHNGSASDSPVKFLKSASSTPGMKHRRYDEPYEEDFDDDMPTPRQVQKSAQKLKNSPENQQKAHQNHADATLDFRDTPREASKPAKQQDAYQPNYGQAHEEIYDVNPNHRKQPTKRPTTPEDDVFPPPPRSTSANFEGQKRAPPQAGSYQAQNNQQEMYQNQAIHHEIQQNHPAIAQRMVLNKDSYENTLARPPRQVDQAKPPPPRPATQVRQAQNSSHSQPEKEGAKKNFTPPAKGFQNLQEVELRSVNSKSTEKQDLENWSKLVPHSKVTSVIQMLNKKEATNGTLQSGNQTKNKNSQNRTTPQLQRQNTLTSVPNTPQVQRHQFSTPKTRQDNEEFEQPREHTVQDRHTRSTPHQNQPEEQEIQSRSNVLQRNQNSNFVPYENHDQVQRNQHARRQNSAQSGRYQENSYPSQEDHRLQAENRQIPRHEQDIYEEQQFYQSRQESQTRQYYDNHQNPETTPKLAQKPIPQHRNSLIEGYHQHSNQQSQQRNHTSPSEPAKVASNPPPAPPLPEGGVLKSSASRKNSLNPSASQSSIANIAQKRSPPMSHHSQEEKSVSQQISQHASQRGSVSISTDSALSSDDYTNSNPSNKHSHQEDSTLDSQNDLNTEAELLLMYFKHNRHVLNYLRIGLPEDLWQHIRALPDKKVKLKICDEKSNKSKNSRTQNGKVVRRVSTKNDRLDRRQRRKSNIMLKQDEEKKRDSFLAGQAMAFGDAVISISKGPYPGYNGGEHDQMVHEVAKMPPPPMMVDKRKNPDMKEKEKEIVRDFVDLSRQMVASDVDESVYIQNKMEVEHQRRSQPQQVRHQPINRNISMDSLTEDELMKCRESCRESHDELEDRRSLKNDITDNEDGSPAKWNFLKKSGRFVKKSAAALIAKKQTSTTNSPVPTLKVASSKTAAVPRKPFPEFKQTEYRIAEEIANLREREDELRRNRSAMGLPSLDDIVDTWRQGHDGPRMMMPHLRQRYHYEELHRGSPMRGSPLRGAQSFDHLHIRVQDEKPVFDEFEGSGYTIGPKVTKSESFHHIHDRMDNFYYEKSGAFREPQQYGTDQFIKQQRGRRVERESLQNLHEPEFYERQKIVQNNEKIQQVNIKIHPVKRPERSETLDSNRTAESKRSKRSGTSSKTSKSDQKKRFFTHATTIMRL